MGLAGITCLDLSSHPLHQAQTFITEKSHLRRLFLGAPCYAGLEAWKHQGRPDPVGSQAGVPFHSQWELDKLKLFIFTKHRGGRGAVTGEETASCILQRYFATILLFLQHGYEKAPFLFWA